MTHREHANVSFVSSTETPVENPEAFIDPAAARAMRQVVSDQERAYNLKRQYGVVSRQDQLDQLNMMKNMQRDVLRQMQRYQLKTKGKRAQNNAENNESFDSVRGPLTVLAAATAVSTGSPVRFHLGRVASFNAKTDVLSRRGSFSMNSILLDGALEYDGRAEDYNPANPGVSLGREQYRLRLSREIPLVECATDFVYGATTGSMNAQLSRRLIDNVTASVGTSRGVVQNASRNSEQTFRLLYGIQF